MAACPNEFEIRERYSYRTPAEKSFMKRIHDSVRCDSKSVRNFFFGFFPILTWLPNYSVKKHLPGDLIGGVTTAIVRIPQSLAYGLLAGVDPINGMYTAFFSPLVYTFLGTSSHISVGTFAVISLMIGSSLEKFMSNNPFVSAFNATSTTTVSSVTEITIETATGGAGETLDSSSELAMYKLSIVASLTLLVGFIQIFLGMCNMGFVALFLSDPLVSGFTTGAAVYVFTAQVKYFFGISLARQSAPFSLIKTYYELFERIHETKAAEVIISVITIVMLYPIKVINVKYKKKLNNVPIPMELVIVVIATIVSANIDLRELYGVEIVGKVPSGLPMPSLPKISFWSDLVSDAISVAIVSFAITVSIGKLFAKKHGYKIAPNQELFALGVSQLSCAVFQGHACSGSLARSSVKESSGTKTQFSDIVSCVVILLVLLFVGPMLKPLPVACLSSIIMVNVRTLFHQFLRLPYFWKLCKYDFTIWIVTFVATILLGVDMGLVVGVVALLGTVVIRKYNAKLTISGQLGNSNLYRDINDFEKAEEVDGAKMVRFSESPFFGNKEELETACAEIVAVKKTLTKELKLARLLHGNSEQAQAFLADSSNDSDPSNRSSLLKSDPEWSKQNGGKESKEEYVVMVDSSAGSSLHDTKSLARRSGSTSSMTSQSSRATAGLHTQHAFHTIIFDCTCWTFIDTMGVDTVKQVCRDFKTNSLRVFLAGLNRDVFYKLSESDVFADDIGAVPYSSLEYAAVMAKVPPVETEECNCEIKDSLDQPERETVQLKQTEV